jgi:isoaspartyl peptidase/L-asparaginase-like protein (Ntn-hydrolase superfamily)
VSTPVLVASELGEVGLPAAMDLLRSGGSAMDAVEAAVRAAEDNEADHYVGVGGLPNLLGEVELDASIMDGGSLRAGAVAAVTGFRHPISIARAVCERLPQHVLLVGAGAERFAGEIQAEQGPLLTAEARRLWQRGLTDAGLADAAEESPGEAAYRRSVLDRLRAMEVPGGRWGTVNVLARDAAGNLASGVSTSGYPWKYPGRVGDSAVIGAGNYCDNRTGAAACTGRGELAIRGVTARAVLHRLAATGDPRLACAGALRETLALADPFRTGIQALCLTPDGRHGGASTAPGATYSVMTPADAAPRFVERLLVRGDRP